MDNTIEYAQVLQEELDKSAVEQATSGWMEVNSKLVKYDGGREVKIPQIEMDGLGDYDRKKGFPEGSIALHYETKTMEMDRGRQFTLDEHDVSETNFVLTASSVMGEFQRELVLPEIDAYRYSTIAANCIAKDRASYGYEPNENTILSKLYYDLARVQDIVGHETSLVITIGTMVAAILSTSDKLSKKLDVSDFKQGDVSLKVKSLDGIYPLIRASSNCLKTEYLFRDGREDAQKVGGFTPTQAAKDINWIITPRQAPMAVSKTDKIRIFDPETYQRLRAWSMDYRKYHDLWITDKKIKQCFVNIRQEKESA
jgi:hypothetical protein